MQRQKKGVCVSLLPFLLPSWVYGYERRTDKLPVIFQSLIKTRKQGHDGKDGPLSGQGVPQETAVSL